MSQDTRIRKQDGTWVQINGEDGEGVPTGGAPTEVLAKASAADFDTEWVAQTGGVSDHGALTGLGDDDHPQYVLDAGDTMSGTLTVPDISISASGIAGPTGAPLFITTDTGQPVSFNLERLVNVGAPVSADDAATKDYVDDSVAAGLADGDKGDITVSSSGTVWTIDSQAVTAAKIANDTITDTQLAANSVTASELADNAVDTAAIADDAVTNVELANMATATFKGRVTGGTGNPEDLTGTQATTLLDAFTSGLKGLAPASGGGSTTFLRADGTWVAPPALTDGDKGDITVSASGATWTIDNDVVSNAKAANVPTATIKGRVTAATGDPEDLTGTQATTLLDTFTSSLKGLAPSSGGGSTNFLRADGTWTAPPGTGGVSDGDKGDVTVSSSGTVWTVDNDVVSNAKLANVATATFKGRTTASTGDPEDLTVTQATAMLNAFTSSLKGLAPASGGGTLNFLRADGTWAQTPTPVFADASFRDAFFTSPVTGDTCSVQDSNTWQYYDGVGWLGYTAGWAAYTPTLTNITLGNGTFLARVKYVGTDMQIQVFFQMGSTSSMGSNPTFSLPTPMSATMAFHAINAAVAHGLILDAGTAGYECHGYTASTTTVGFGTWNASGTYSQQNAVSATVPHTWAISDCMTLAPFTLEMASPYF